jgi:hypothetical protein
MNKNLFAYLSAEAFFTQQIQIGPLDEPDEEIGCPEEMEKLKRFEIVKLPPRKISLVTKSA